MRIRTAVILLGLLALSAAPAHASYSLGVSEQSAALFGDPAWQRLGLRDVRYLVPWDWERTGQQAQLDAYMTAARARRQRVLVTFTARRGCFDGGRYSRERICRAPGVRAFRAAFRRFDDRYPWVQAYAAWNEVNHISQPTFTRPRLAVRYFRVLRAERRRRAFRLLAADVLDTANLHRYLRAFLRLAPGRPRLWGLHNYQDVNDRTSADTRRMLRSVPGEVWLTEANGIVKFAPQWQYSETRAARRTRWMLRLADRYDARRRGLLSRISRVYVYQWFGAAPDARFDAGVVAADGTPRPAYRVLERAAQRRGRPR